MSDTSEGGVSQPSLQAEKRNGVYLLEIEANRIGYIVRSGENTVVVGDVSIHGHYIGTSDYFETECTDFDITEDGTLNLQYDDTDT